MARKDLNDVLIERLHRQQKQLAERLVQARAVAEGVNSPFWKAYRKMMADKLEHVQNGLVKQFENIDSTLTNEQIRCTLTTVGNLKMFIDGPSDFAKSVEAMEEKLEKIKAELDERKSKL